VLGGMTKLTYLSLKHTQVTDVIIPELLKLQQLRYLNLEGTKMTADPTNQLASLPHLGELY
jgi:Leucine-rich repeat (LRR) protein